MLVGRETALARCRAALDAAVAGEATLIEVLGEAGIGKTALLSAVAGLDGRFRRLRVTGVPTEAAIAYAGLDALLRPLTERIDVLPPHQQRALRAALRLEEAELPDLLTLVGSALALLAEGSAERPLLLTIDDAQWLDEPSRIILGGIGRRLGGERIVMLVASRDTRPLRGDAEPIRLAGLSEDESERLVRELRSGVSTVVAGRLHERAAGIPLYLAELTDRLTDRQAAGLSALAETARVPDDIRSAQLDRLESRSPGARLLLLLLALLGRGDVPTLAAAAAAVGIDGPVDSVLDELVSADLVEIADLDVAVCHPLLRATVIDAAGPLELGRAHLGLASVLADTDPDRALWHRATAPRGPDEALAAELTSYAERLAARAQPDSARRALERAAALSTDSHQRAERLVRAAELSLVGTSGAVVAGLLDTIRPMVASWDVRQRARVQVVEAWMAVQRGQGARAAATLLDAAVELTEPQRTQIAMSVTARAIEDRDHESVRRGLAMLSSSGSASVGHDVGRFAAVTQEALAYLSTPRRGGLPSGLRAALADWPSTTSLPLLDVLRAVAMEGGQLVTAREVSTAAVELARGSGEIAALAGATLALGFCDHALANWNSAVARAYEVTRLVEESFATTTVVEALLLLADIEASRGGRDECRTACARIRELSDRVSNPEAGILADRREALLDLPGDDPSAALPRLVAARQQFDRAGVGHPFFSPVPDLIEVLLRLGRRDEAQALAPEFLRLVDDDAPPPPRARALRVRALVTEGGDYDDLFEASVALDETTGQSFHAARTMLCQGERRRRDGRRVDARARLEPALEVFRRVEAVPWIQRTERELAATGVAVAKPAQPMVTETLTTQELQIAALVAEGHRNSEIAAALYLSPKTVEFHLTRAFRKAGVSNRTQLASLMRHSAPS